MMLREEVARAIDPKAWQNWDDRAARKEFTAEELPLEFAEWVADHPNGGLARSLQNADAAIDIVVERCAVMAERPRIGTDISIRADIAKAIRSLADTQSNEGEEM